MKYLKFTYVDSVTGISVASHPAENGPVFPPVAGLEYAWARESRYPTDVPEFFGTCPDASDTQIDGVLGVYSKQDWEIMRADEMAARNPAPQSCTPAQGLIALYALKQITEQDIATSIASITDPVQRYTAQIGYSRATQWERGSATMQAMAALLGLSEADLDALFAYAVGVQV
jgi:hypothetical protein